MTPDNNEILPLERILGRMRAAGTIDDRSRVDRPYEEPNGWPMEEPKKSRALMRREGSMVQLRLRSDLGPHIRPDIRAAIDGDGYELALRYHHDKMRNLTVPSTVIRMKPGQIVMLTQDLAVEALISQHGQFVEEVPEEPSGAVGPAER